MKYYVSVNLFLILMLIWLRVDKHPGDQKRLIAYESRLGDFLGDLLRGSAGFCLKCTKMIDHQTVHPVHGLHFHFNRIFSIALSFLDSAAIHL